MAEENKPKVNNFGPRGHGPMGPRPKIENPGKILKRLMGIVLKKYWGLCLIVLISIFASAIANVKAQLFLQKLIDDYITPLIGQTDPSFAPLAAAIGKISVFLIIGVVSSYLTNRLMVNVEQGTMRDMRRDLFAHMQSLPIKYFDSHAHGDIMSVYTNDIDTLRQMIGMSMPQLISSTVTVISVFVSMVILDIPLTILSCAMVAVMMLVTKKLAGKSSKYFVSQQKDLGSVNGYIEEMLGGQKVVKVFNHEDKCQTEFKERNDKLCESANKANGYANILMPVNAQLGNVSFALCAVVGAVLAINGYGSLTLGTLVAFLSLNKNFNQPIAQISGQLNSVIMALAGAERVFKMMDEEPEEDNGYVTLVNAKEKPDGSITEVPEKTEVWAWKHPHQADGTVTYQKLGGKVTFGDVDFGYDPDKTVLHHITMFAEPGQKIAFVGSTGAGKTTITNLINRFYDIQDGKIRYDDININKIRKPDLRRSLGMVLQDTHLFTGTVMDNIRYGKLDATDAECIDAAKLANADGFISRLPDGYDTVLTGDGSNLSQGQRQLIAIARTAVADPPALILDEATSSIDTHTEKLVQEGMDRLMHGRTTFVIAHRLSTVRNSDCIMVLENGEIIERGTHDELIAEKGRYYTLYTGMAAGTESTATA